MDDDSLGPGLDIVVGLGLGLNVQILDDGGICVDGGLYLGLDLAASVRGWRRVSASVRQQ